MNYQYRFYIYLKQINPSLLQQQNTYQLSDFSHYPISGVCGIFLITPDHHHICWINHITIPFSILHPTICGAGVFFGELDIDVVLVTDLVDRSTSLADQCVVVFTGHHQINGEAFELLWGEWESNGGGCGFYVWRMANL